MRIELLWFEGCPSHQRAKELLEQVLREEGIADQVEMIQVHDDADARARKFLGSPTIRINGVDPFVEPNQKSFAIQCRMYHSPESLNSVPTKAMLRAAVRDFSLRSN